jgi:phage shock protein A
MLDETFKQFLDNWSVEALGPNYRKTREYINDLITAKRQYLQKIGELEAKIQTHAEYISSVSNKNSEHSQKIDSLEKKINSLPKNVNQAMTALQSSLKTHVDSKIANELTAAKHQYLQKISELEAKIQTHAEIILNAGNSEHSQKIDSLEKKINDIPKTVSQAKTELQSSFTNYVNSLNSQINSVITSNQELERRIAALEAKNNTLMSRNNEYESKRVPTSPAQSVQTDSNISQFNAWAASPTTLLPAGFTFLAGEPRIRMSQQLAETAEETKWITNRTGVKKYLLPNPNLFNQMTDIHELYYMDQNMLKEKGKNKIKIITPCEISAAGWIGFPGKLKILP